MMQIGECLQRIGSQELRQIASQHAVAYHGHSRQQLYQSLLTHLRQTTVTYDSVARLSADERKLLKLICLVCTDQTLDPYALEHFVLGIGLADQVRLSLLRRMQALGLIYKITSQNYQRTYVIPDEIYGHLEALYVKEIKSGLIRSAEPSSYRQDERLLLLDLVRCMTVVQSGQIRKTKQGLLYKKSRQLIDQNLLGRGDTRRVTGYYETDSRFVLMWAFLCNRKMLQLKESHSYEVSPLWSDWLQKADNLKVSDIYQFWQRDFYWQRTSHLYTKLLCRFLAVLEEKEWVTVESIASSYRSMLPQFTLEASFAAWFDQLIWHLVYLNVLAIATNDQVQVISLTSTGRKLLKSSAEDEIEQEQQHSAFFYCQPNYQLLVSKEMALSELWLLGQIAEMQQGDQILIYLLTKQSLYRALQLDWTLNSIKDFISKHSHNGLPQNVAASLERWGDKFGEIYFLDTCLLRCRNKHIAKDIQTSARLSPFILGALNETDLMVEREHFKKILHLLCNEGYMPYQVLFNPHTDPGFKKSKEVDDSVF